ncbi:AraC family transcriptional regulator [Cohnella thailandensis]|uniref:AraC family transcriptional regulator n=1 Tax=Cohnella thailandensis TaxID=557557 RepID=A0A841SMD5_9BACL|nr:AraC family transcriptional regulator [Cohnella thailandensis]MBB6633094.1 AraC family transcriptional regulator [Cohnella thailandensis]MBP1975211.1 AraC-like DNA-binding protein [Cohnella thailandensis]
MSMNNPSPLGLQQDAAGLLGYRLLDVRILRDAPRSSLTERAFIKPKAHLLLLSNAPGGRLVIDGRPHALRHGSLFVCAPGQLIEWTNYWESPLELLLLEFQVFFTPKDDAPSFANREKAVFPFLGEAAMPSSSSTGALFDLIADEWARMTPSSRLRCEAGLLELLSVALNHQERQTEIALEASRIQLERNYASEITVDALASSAGLSRFHFMRLFKERFGKGVMEYRTDLRLQEAKRLMNEGNHSLTDIVQRIGYASESYFSHLFKKQVGFAPAIYQRNQRRKIAAYSWANIGQLLALRMIPCAAPMDQFWTDRYRSRYAYEVRTALSHRYDFNLEALREVRPERIIGFDGLVPVEEQEKLREIAPSLFLNGEEDWRAHFRQAASFLEKDEEAEAWLKRYDRTAEAVREKLEPIVCRDAVLVLLVGRDRLMVWGRRAGTVLYDDLCFVAPEGIRETPWFREIEPGELSGMGADRILVHVNRSPASQSRWTELIATRLWKELPAVRENKVDLLADNDFLEAPWNEYSAEPIGRFLESCRTLF